MTRAVLTFHSIDDSGSVLSYRPRAFADLIRGLVESGTPVLAFDALAAADHGVTLTFDDGFASVARHALPVLAKHHLPAHVFVTTSRIGLDNHWPSQPAGALAMPMMDRDDIDRCVAAGMTVENHTATHPDLRTLSREQVMEEYAAADEVIERLTGRRPRLLAYPYGYVGPVARDIAAARYATAFTTRLAYLTDHTDPHATPRLDTYYLQHPQIARRFMRPSGQAYLALRGLIRSIRGRS